MDAYSSYILTWAKDEASDRRREAAEYGMSRAASRSRISLWTRTVVRARATTAARRGTRGLDPSPTVVPAK